MALAWSFPHAVGVIAGVLIIAVGGFVLLARPNAWLNRFFFVLALMDGASTILYQFTSLGDSYYSRMYFRGLFWYFQIAFVTALVAFGLSFPRPVVVGVRGVALVVAIVAAGALSLAWYAVDHGAFWRPVPERSGFLNLTGSNLVQAAFWLSIGLISAKLLLELRRSDSPSRSRQAAFVLGGMTLGYAPFVTSNLVREASVGVERFTSEPWAVLVGRWGYVVTTAVLAVTFISVARDRRAAFQDTRRIILWSLGGVGAITVLAVTLPDAGLTYLAQRLGLVAYPVLVGYAIVRYELFDINSQLRRAATLTIVGATLATVFILAENALENALANSVAGALASPVAAGAIAAVLAAILWVPVTRQAHKLSRRFIPDLPADALHARKIEIYRHGLEGALADGIVRERESRTLAALRESLGITVAEHDRIFAEVASRAPAATAAAPA